MDSKQNDNVDLAEIAKFDALAATWWDTEGDFKSLHAINPLRLDFITRHASLAQQQVIDVGCGGGILAESMAKLGACVTGLDLSAAVLDIARQHAQQQQLSISYQAIDVASVASAKPEKFDILTCMEMLEHVPDPCAIIQACAALVKPGGHLFFSTINRNAKAYLEAIVGAEYLLKLLPKGTHDYAKFIRPAEFAAWARMAGLKIGEFTGMTYNPITRLYRLTPNIGVNYLVHCQRNE